MPLTQQQKDELRAHAKDSDKACLRCRANLSIGDVVKLPLSEQNTGQHVPCIALICGKCGHIELISAAVAGVTT